MMTAEQTIDCGHMSFFIHTFLAFYWGLLGGEGEEDSFYIRG